MINCDNEEREAKKGEIYIWLYVSFKEFNPR
jgi:hypothetical protein